MTENAKPMLVALACDHAGVELKEQLKPLFQQLGLHVEDFGTHGPESIDYPDYAHVVARAVAEQRFARGVLICGSGIGMCITANRHAGVRAAVCSEAYSARMTRMHNDANVLCLGARVIGLGTAEEVVKTFFGTPFEGGRHGARVAKIEVA
jgi:ribose 5-phosphate isomerase B